MSPPVHNPFFHVAFIVPDLDAAMEEFRVALGIEWRAPTDAIVPLLGPGGVVEAEVYSVYSDGGPPAIELVQSVPGTPLAGDGGVSFHHLGFWTDRLADSSDDLGAHGWPCVATVASPESNTSRFTLQQSPHGFYVELFDTATPRHADLLPNPNSRKDTALNTASKIPPAPSRTRVGTNRTHPRERTGVRFVLTNATDPGRADDYSAWYDDYENAIIRPGLLANAFRFENPHAAGTPTDPRYAAIYDIVSPDPASAWPQIENSPGYPRHLFDDPRSRLVAPALRASYALTGSLETDRDHGDLTGVHIILSDGGTDTLRKQRAAALLKTGLFYGASRFRIIEGSPDPPAWLEVFETDLHDPLSAYTRACDGAESQPADDGVHQRSSRPFALVAGH